MSGQVGTNTSKDLSKSQGALAYRFGRLGKVELEFPSSSKSSLKRFRHAHYFRYQTDYTEVSFSIGKFTYSIFDYYNGDEKQQYSRGVLVSNHKEKSKKTELLCSKQIKSALQKLDGLVLCDTNNPLANCN